MALTNVVAAQTVYQQVAPNEYLFPGLCKKQNGDYLLMARRASGHLVADGRIVMRTSPTGLAGSWSSEQVILTSASFNSAAAIPRLLDDGRVAVMTWYDDADASPPYVTTTYVSTDETCTAWVQGGILPAQLGGGSSWGGNACECPVTVMPDGTWLLATYGPEMNGDSSWSSMLYESADEGASWAFKTYVARAPSPTPRFGTPNYEEPFLLHISGDELICAVRCGESGWDGTYGRYTHIFRSTDAGDTWSDEGRVNSTHQHASRMALCRNPLTGTIMLHHRLLYQSGGYAWSGHGAYYWSNDDGATWSAGKGLDSDASPPSNPTSPPAYSYGDIVVNGNGFAALWADEVPISGSGSAIRFATYSDDAPLLPQPPTVTGSDVGGITQTAATIIGNVNPNGAATTYIVEYGETTSYGTETSPVSAGSGSSPVAVEVGLSGLDADTAYHARLVATNANGTTNGPDIQFTTDDLGLTIAGSSIWAQDGYDLTVTGASANTRHSTTATVSSRNGGTVRFTGADAAAFYVSSDGSIWASSLSVPAGSTDIHVSVLATPEPDMASLSATMLIPV